MRLMGAVAIEYNDQLSVKSRVFAEKTFNKFRLEILPKLKDIASNQQSLLDAHNIFLIKSIKALQGNGFDDSCFFYFP